MIRSFMGTDSGLHVPFGEALLQSYRSFHHPFLMPTTRRTGPARLIAHMAGGLGNQMFIYAAARCLSMRHGIELVLDTKSGFSVDRRYERTFQLQHLNLPTDILQRSFAYHAPNRWLLALRRRIERQLPETWRSWLFDTPGEVHESWKRVPRIGMMRLEGYWQNERHFSGCSALIRKELTPPEPVAGAAAAALRRIRNTDSIGIHLRLQNPPSGRVGVDELRAYYREALEIAQQQARGAKVYAFSDDLPQARALLTAIGVDAEFSNGGTAVLDMLMMSCCRALIIAPSTLSWWAAWLSHRPGKVIIAPELDDGWGFARLLRPDWIRLPPGASRSVR